jgi:hypothetical protein
VTTNPNEPTSERWYNAIASPMTADASVAYYLTVNIAEYRERQDAYSVAGEYGRAAEACAKVAAYTDALRVLEDAVDLLFRNTPATGPVDVNGAGTVWRYSDGVVGFSTDEWRIFIAADRSDVMVRPASDTVPTTETGTDRLGHGWAKVAAV